MRPIDELREKIDLWKKSTTDTALMSVLHDVLKQIDAAIYEMDHQEAKARGARWRNRRMSDPIDRGDVLGVISCFFKDNDIDGLADLEREINRLSTASQWRSVEEPPKEEGKYLVYDGRGNYFVAWWGPRLGWCYDPKFFCYWMPIEPPKEEE